MTIANGDGPTVLVSGGTHGDEYEGQIAALRLVAEIEPAQVSGRIIAIPVISTEASQAHSRFWPSGANFNRSFPGRLDGPPDEVLADFFTTVLFPLVDMIVEMHSGGSGSLIVPCSHMCVVDDPVQRRAMLEGMEAWNSDVHFLYTAGDNYFPTIAQGQGKTIVTTELGGGGRVPPPCTSSRGAASRTFSATSACSRARPSRAPRWGCRPRASTTRGEPTSSSRRSAAASSTRRGRR